MAHRYALCAALLPVAAAKDDGLALTPPMGWQTWLAYMGDVNQTIFNRVIDVVTGPGPDGGKSLLELGYSNLGLDDGWQACGTGIHGSFHDASGRPLVNETRFPDLKAMTDNAHGLGLTVSWYGNNCLCKEKDMFTRKEIDTVYQGDADAIVGYGFDGIKFDGCGPFLDLPRQSQLLNASGHPTVMENCHWGNDGPHRDEHTGELVCPFHFFRSSGDMGKNFESVVSNLQSVYRWNRGDKPLSQPGCWAYPDEMAVGLLPYAESRANFAAWCVTSSPLTLTFDLTDADALARMWPIISNEEMIAVNQEWAGHPGNLVRSVLPPGTAYLWGERCDESDPAQQGWEKRPLSDDKFLIAWQGNLCVTSSKSRPVKLASCNPSDPLQAFGTNELGVLSHDGADDYSPEGTYSGLDLFGKRGPVVSLDQSYGAGALNEQFYFRDRQLRDKGTDGEGVDGDGKYPTRCLAVREASPEFTYIDEIRWQIWAKPLLRGRVAVVVFNRKEEDLKAMINFSDLGLSGEVHVRDLFEHKDLGTFSSSFLTDDIPVRDSRMLMLTPVATSLDLPTIHV